MEKRKFLLFLKGMAMGGADIIPGVSGGTIALITGIYEELIDSVKSMDGNALRELLKLRLGAFWTRINGAFLVNVFLGIIFSIFSLARLVTYLMESQPILLWSFFFGLIFISAFYVFPKQKTPQTYLSFLLGAFLAYVVTSLSPADTPESSWFIFISGMIAICAMILPGISGSFILLLLGKYQFILEAAKSFDLWNIVVFAMGCLVGIISFSKLIHWLLQHYKGVTLATLSGFMLGSLNKIWPWKQIHGDSFMNLLPSDYTVVTGQPNELYLASVFFLLGAILVIGLERMGKKIA